MLNTRFGKLTVIGDAPSVLQTNGKRKRAVMAKCDCGTLKAFIVSNLKNGNSKSCGCGKYAGMKAANAERATPQEWIVDGDTAHIFVGRTKILVDSADVPIVGRYRWGVRNGYAVARGGRLSMHRILLGLESGDPREADHAHHNTTDNRRSEIRIADSSQNKMNKRGNVIATSKFKGVHFDATRNRYAAQIKTSNRVRLIGRYATEIEAALAYNAEARKHFGEFAYLNPV